jgi:hypothetical protein
MKALRLVKSKIRLEKGENAILIRHLAIVAIRAAGEPLPLRKVYNSIVRKETCDFQVRYDYFLSSLCSDMGRSRFVIYDGLIDIARF